MNNTEIINYQPDLAGTFKSLNLEWIEKYFTLEAADEEILGDPDFHIIQQGGRIFFARHGGQVAGTFALIKTSEHEYELAKMAVAASFQGKQIGNAMLRFCIEEAKRIGVDKLVLFSNKKLKPAIHLYEKFGFREVALEHSAYQRSNIKMELDLKA